MSAAEMEKALLKRVEDEKESTEALWRLARWYQHSKQIEKGVSCLRQILAQMPDPENKAGCVLAMGQMMETAEDYAAAVRYYKEALAMEPTHTSNWYFINNNLGFSLNTLGEFVEGETYCRRAIDIDPNLPNAHKNLGISLAGQGEYRKAAKRFVTATQVNAADGRALRLLQDLIKQHPELAYDFEEAAACCQKATEVATKKAAALEPVIYRGWRKRLILFQMKLRFTFQRIWKRARDEKRNPSVG
ncbi:MAG TPA: tetratricopeptide repeat protein [Terriglobales bacterium]|nr:tetratricopeptide repeat protein [Terriglobales bacterium]